MRFKNSKVCLDNVLQKNELYILAFKKIRFSQRQPR